MKRSWMSVSLIVVLLLTLLMGFQRVQANSALPAALKDQGASNERDLQELLKNEQLATVQLSYHNILFYVDFFEILSSQVPLLDQYEVEYYGERLSASSVLMELAHYHSINPAVLLSFLQVESGVLTNPEWNSLELAMGYDSEESYGFAAQIARLAESLNGYYHAAMSKGTTNAGHLAIIQVLAEKEPKQLESRIYSFTQAYQTIVKGMDLSEIDRERQIPNINSQPYMYLPWTYGNTMYYTGGPHSWAGALSAVDFAPGGGSGCNWTSYEPIKPARYGRVVYVGPVGISNPYHIKVDHWLQEGDDYWATDYYHLRNIPSNIQVGSYVARTTTLGYPSCEPAGSSTGVHLHFAFLYAGNGTPAHGKRLTGWTIYAGSAPYEGTMVKSGTVITATSSKINGVNDIPNW